MRRLPITDRPHALLVNATITTGNVTITAPLAILVLAKSDEDEAGDTKEPSRPGLAKALPSILPPNVVVFPRRRAG